jgi:hypothetical protein
LLEPSRLMVTDRFTEPLMGLSLVAWADRAAASPIAPEGAAGRPRSQDRALQRTYGGAPHCATFAHAAIKEIARRKQGQGSAPGLRRCRPETRQGALPPGPPPKAAAFGIHSFCWGEGGALRGPARAAGNTPAFAGVIPAAQAGPRNAPPSPQQTDGFQGPLPLAGIQGAAPLGGVQGQRPWPCFLRPKSRLRWAGCVGSLPKS